MRPRPVSPDQALLVAYLDDLLLNVAALPSLPRQRSLVAVGKSHASPDDHHHHEETPKEDVSGTRTGKGDGANQQTRKIISTLLTTLI